MKIKIEKMDHNGRGIGYLDNKIVFIPKCIPDDYVEAEILKVKKSFSEAKLKKIIIPSASRIEALCPYFNKCGGCDLQELSYDNTLNYKKDKLINIFKKLNITINPIVVKNEKPFYYRNKIELKINNGKIGYYEKETNSLVEISKCIISKEAINKTLSFIKNLKINNGNITIRCNCNDEIMLVINTSEKISFDFETLKKDIKLIGVILNEKCIYGESYFIERVNDLFFQVSYNSFFQVNYYMVEKLFELISRNITLDDKVLDLFCGVGTLSIVAASKAKEVLGIEIIGNAVVNAISNAKINQVNNVKFILNDVSDAIDKIKLDFNTIIVDPPRKGLDKKSINVILNNDVNKIIYVSCNPQTLVRDLEILLKKYDLEKVYLLDMFSYSYHVESMCILKRR